MDAERWVRTTIPHMDFGDPECCGCLDGVIRGDVAIVECNECGAILRSVPAADLEKTLHEMGLSLEMATAICSHCGAVKLTPGLSQLLAFVCDEGGEVTKLADDPNIEQIKDSCRA